VPFEPLSKEKPSDKEQEKWTMCMYIYLSFLALCPAPSRELFLTKNKRERAFINYMEPSAEGKICLVKSVNRFAGNDQSFLLDCNTEKLV